MALKQEKNAKMQRRVAPRLYASLDAQKRENTHLTTRKDASLHVFFSPGYSFI